MGVVVGVLRRLIDSVPIGGVFGLLMTGAGGEPWSLVGRFIGLIAQPQRPC